MHPAGLWGGASLSREPWEVGGATGLRGEWHLLCVPSLSAHLSVPVAPGGLRPSALCSVWPEDCCGRRTQAGAAGAVAQWQGPRSHAHVCTRIQGLGSHRGPFLSVGGLQLGFRGFSFTHLALHVPCSAARLARPPLGSGWPWQGMSREGRRFVLGAELGGQGSSLLGLRKRHRARQVVARVARGVGGVRPWGCVGGCPPSLPPGGGGRGTASVRGSAPSTWGCPLSHSLDLNRDSRQAQAPTWGTRDPGHLPRLLSSGLVSEGCLSASAGGCWGFRGARGWNDGSLL